MNDEDFEDEYGKPFGEPELKRRLGQITTAQKRYGLRTITMAMQHAGEHMPDCRCLDCMIWWATSDDEDGPFDRIELNQVRVLIGHPERKDT